MKFTWIETQKRKPKVKEGFNILSENVLALMPSGEYTELYFDHKKTLGAMPKTIK